jgi:hypothetical protein
MSIKLPKLGLNGQIEPCLENVVDLLNENFEILDLTSSFSVERGPALPASSSLGDAFLVDGDNTIYYWTDSWQSFTPTEGLFIYDQTNDQPIVFDGSNWVDLSNFLVQVTASNQGSGSEVFKQKTGQDLEFRSLVAGANVSLNQSADEIEIVAAGGSGLGGFTEVSSNGYIIQANDNNIAVSGNRTLIMPDPTLFPGRRIRFFIQSIASASLPITLRDHTDSVDLFNFRREDVQTKRSPGSGSNQRAVPFIEFMSYNFTSQGSVFWGISDFSDKIKANKLATSLQTIDGTYDLNSPLVLFQQSLGSTELFNSINISTSFETEHTGSNANFVFRYDTRINSGSWISGKAYVVNYNGSQQRILYLDETINATGSGSNQHLEVRLGCYRLNGSSNLTVGDATVGALVAEVLVKKEL